MRELVEAEKAATAQVKGLKSDLANEKAQHEQQVRMVPPARMVPAAACMQQSGVSVRQAACGLGAMLPVRQGRQSLTCVLACGG